jgi:hypothetical protein
MGKGSITGISKKQKINTRSSTASKLVGVHGVAPHMLWTRYFIEAQGYKLDESVLNQDNVSVILLEQTTKNPAVKGTNTSMLGTSSSRTASNREKLPSNIVQQTTCWRTASRNHSPRKPFQETQK